MERRQNKIKEKLANDRVMNSVFQAPSNLLIEYFVFLMLVNFFFFFFPSRALTLVICLFCRLKLSKWSGVPRREQQAMEEEG